MSKIGKGLCYNNMPYYRLQSSMMSRDQAFQADAGYRLKWSKYGTLTISFRTSARRR